MAFRRGSEGVRKEVAEYIEKRDGYPSSPDVSHAAWPVFAVADLPSCPDEGASLRQHLLWLHIGKVQVPPYSGETRPSPSITACPDGNPQPVRWYRSCAAQLRDDSADFRPLL